MRFSLEISDPHGRDFRSSWERFQILMGDFRFSWEISDSRGRFQILVGDFRFSWERFQILMGEISDSHGRDFRFWWEISFRFPFHSHHCPDFCRSLASYKCWPHPAKVDQSTGPTGDSAQLSVHRTGPPGNQGVLSTGKEDHCPESI